jgi:hypothetical protein
MWQQEFTWFFTLFHQELRKNDPIAFEVRMVLALAHLFGFYPYNDICLDMLIFPAYVASKGSDHHQEAADVTGTSNRRRGVLHPAV